MSDQITVNSDSTATRNLTEEWRVVPGFPAYSVSSLGRVQHRMSQRMKTLSVADKKYQIIRLVGPTGYIFSRRVHILVALAFIGPKPTPAHEVNHKNGNRLDNRAENLEYVTSFANEQHAAANALKAWGEKHAAHKLTEEAVRFIRRGGGTTRSLAVQFGVTLGTIRAARDRKTWRHLDA